MPRLAVIGFPVAHSRSPAMQNAALAALGLAGEWSYGAVEAAPSAFETTVRELASLRYVGVNVTVPHKEAALALADAASDAARAIGAANTLSFGEGGIAAHNTDAGGLLAAISETASSGGGRALVLGAGGAARAAIWGLAHAEAVSAGRLADFAVDVWNRTRPRADGVYAELGGGGALGGSVLGDPEQRSYDVLVNTTAVGLHGEDPFEHLPLAPERFLADQVVVDMVYGDRPSPLLAAAEEAGATPVDGLEVLVQQGALSLRVWTGQEPPLDVMRAAARA
jgi:shikimate dehydrogenase